MTLTTTPPAASTPPGATPARPPLWPQPIPIIGVTGEYASGKTIFGLAISPRETLAYDLEKSNESYLSFGFTRLDVPAELLRRYPKGYKPLQTFEWWRDHMRSISPGQYRVIMVDPASELENGIVEWVRNNPGYFGRTSAQYVKMSGLLWGDVKELWKSLLADLASRCETFVFAVHMGDVWSGDRPTGKRKPKGKSTLMELASLYLHLERKPDAKGNVPAKPAAIVLKSRLAHTRISPEGDVEVIPALPPRLPVATPAAIRQYLLNPPDYAHLREEEQAPEQQLSEDDRAAVRLATAEAERDAELLRAERLQRQQDAAVRQAAPRQSQAAPPPPTPEARQELPAGVSTQIARSALKATTAAEAPNGHAPSEQPMRQTSSYSAHAITEEQLQTLVRLRSDLWAATMPGASDEAKKEMWLKVLAKRRVDTAHALTQEQAQELIDGIRSKLDALAIQEGLEKRGGSAPQGAPGGGD